MDGNGRWARSRGLERIRGHEHGTTAVRETVEQCAELGVEALTLYAFSEENWRRPALEIKLLMALLKRFLVGERDNILRNGIRLVHAGRRERLPADVLAELDRSIEMSRDNTGMTLCLAIAYGGRAELTDAMRAIARRVQAGEVQPDEIDEAMVSRNLYHPELPHPDLLIRTANERRISNFLLWQISYAEIHITDVCWPDFRKQHLWAAFEDFGGRTRRFGAVVP
ncbi:MAG: di-trans,poly-cis-decaprenylcistransferase [Planctomycetes bacterium]|nr:di-trans,poly-cis-decaprenylcistransferase [Planctomycetota bacterium]MCB9889138.1 di-trans,poly-cis-decaprenylcistransferase [Planctomycetota bacterium]